MLIASYKAARQTIEDATDMLAPAQQVAMLRVLWCKYRPFRGAPRHGIPELSRDERDVMVALVLAANQAGVAAINRDDLVVESGVDRNKHKAVFAALRARGLADFHEVKDDRGHIQRLYVICTELPYRQIDEGESNRRYRIQRTRRTHTAQVEQTPAGTSFIRGEGPGYQADPEHELVRLDVEYAIDREQRLQGLRERLAASPFRDMATDVAAACVEAHGGRERILPARIEYEVLLPLEKLARLLGDEISMDDAIRGIRQGINLLPEGDGHFGRYAIGTARACARERRAA